MKKENYNTAEIRNSPELGISPESEIDKLRKEIQDLKIKLNLAKKPYINYNNIWGSAG